MTMTTFPNWVLKVFAEISTPSITDILNTSFNEQNVPRAWTFADVPPLPAKASTISDYNKDLRLICLTSTLSKVAESIYSRTPLNGHPY